MASYRCPELLVKINYPKPSAPIDKLPPEIMGEIFSMAYLCCVHGSNSFCDAILLHVCRSWRNTALSMPLLWSHIDLVLDGKRDDAYYNRALLWIARSAGVILYIDLRIPDVALEDPGACISKMTTFLAQLSNRVGCCEIGCDFFAKHDLIGQLVTLIIETHVLPTLDVLHLWSKMHPIEVRSRKPPEWRRSLPPASSTLLPARHARELLPPFRVLRLEYLVILEATGAYSGLTELYIHFPQFDTCSLRQCNFARFFISSPTLRVLSLINVDVEEALIQVDRVLLCDLQHLTLISSKVETFHNLLPIFSPMHQPLSMDVSAIPDPGYLSAMRSFFGRSNVITLHCTLSERAKWFVSIPKALPLLSGVTFEYFGSDDPLWPMLLADYCDHLVSGWPYSSLYRITTNSHTYLFC